MENTHMLTTFFTTNSRDATKSVNLEAENIIHRQTERNDKSILQGFQNVVD